MNCSLEQLTHLSGDIFTLEHSYNTIHSVKLCSINVCGLKSKLRSYEFENLLNEHDIICLTETKLVEYDCISVENFSAILKNR